MTGLLKACATGQVDVVKKLLERGANGKHFDKQNRGLLYLLKNLTKAKGTRMLHMLQNWTDPADGSGLPSREPIKVAKPALLGGCRKKVNTPSNKYRHLGWAIKFRLPPKTPSMAVQSRFQKIVASSPKTTDSYSKTYVRTYVLPFAKMCLGSMFMFRGLMCSCFVPIS